MEEKRWRFVTDDDGHWYLIPVELEEEFNKLLSEGEDDCYTEFNNKFYDNYSIGCHPSCFTFENPKEDY